MKALPQFCMNAWRRLPDLAPRPLSDAIEEIPMVYQEQPTDAKDAPILPHIWHKPDGARMVQVGDTWTAADANAPARLADYIRRTVKLGPSKMLGLNIESIPLGDATAAAFWARAIQAIRGQLPGVRVGFYNRHELAHLVDWLGVSLYPGKRIAATRGDRANYREYWYTLDDYRREMRERAAPFIAAARANFRPLFAFGTFRADGDAGDAPGFLGFGEIDAQAASAAEVGAAGVIWWNSIESEKVARRMRNLLAEQSTYADVPREFNAQAVGDPYPVYVS